MKKKYYRNQKNHFIHSVHLYDSILLAYSYVIPIHCK